MFTLMDRNSQHWVPVRLETCDGMKSLGVYIAVDGNEREKYLREKPENSESKLDLVSTQQAQPCTPSTLAPSRV